MESRIVGIESTDRVDTLLECLNPLLGEFTNVHQRGFQLVQLSAGQCTGKSRCSDSGMFTRVSFEV